MSASERVLIHYHRLPDRKDVFDQVVVEETAEAVVTYTPTAPVPRAMRVENRVILEPDAPVVWFTFPGVWHDIGRFHTADGTFTGWYANILTPPEMEPGTWRTTDLFLDVWLPAEGGPARLLDEDEFDQAVRSGWMDAATAARARAEAEHLLKGAATGGWPPPITERWTLEMTRARLGPTP